MNDDMDSYLIAMDTSVVPGPSAADPPAPSVAAFRESPAADHKTRKHSEEEEEKEEEDPDRPPSKKVDIVFTR